MFRLFIFGSSDGKLVAYRPHFDSGEIQLEELLTKEINKEPIRSFVPVDFVGLS